MSAEIFVSALIEAAEALITLLPFTHSLAIAAVPDYLQQPPS
ncbi:MAG: hypothetical protein K0Q94_2551 [Paenibacillus sp.]|jgi:hypothetical protein|nr:hypothetical protein [Paenibacillus sp.]